MKIIKDPMVLKLLRSEARGRKLMRVIQEMPPATSEETEESDTTRQIELDGEQYTIKRV